VSRLVTYDREGRRRLGALVDGDVVDVPSAVGDDAFPTTMEGLVEAEPSARDAIRTAIERGGGERVA
jgi:hypothetical protein